MKKVFIITFMFIGLMIACNTTSVKTVNTDSIKTITDTIKIDSIQQVDSTILLDSIATDSI